MNSIKNLTEKVEPQFSTTPFKLHLVFAAVFNHKHRCAIGYSFNCDDLGNPNSSANFALDSLTHSRSGD